MKRRILFLGPPGAGKGTQAIRIASKYGLLHLSTGDLLREEVTAGTELGKEAKLIMNKGELVSDQLVLSIVEKRISNQKEGWLLDGFPRNLVQAASLQSLLEKINQPIEQVLLLELTDEVLIKRLLTRGRSDDTEETIKNRLTVYKEKTTPLIEHYSLLGLLKSVNGDGEMEEIENKIEEILI
tara:strand:- start:1181 stop:1729 length:549 start_codon:yes stop_codon:yes gene_type:complete